MSKISSDVIREGIQGEHLLPAEGLLEGHPLAARQADALQAVGLPAS
jgi:hypothetical protein